MAQRRDWTDPAFLRGAPEKSPAVTVPDPLPTFVVVITAFVRYSLAALLAYCGACTIAPSMAQPLEALLATSPALGWLYAAITAEDAARLIGATMVGTAILLAARPLSAVLCLAGSVLAIAIFATTLSLLFTPPGHFVMTAGFPLPVATPISFFLMKDVILLGVSLWSFAEAVHALRHRRG